LKKRLKQTWLGKFVHIGSYIISETLSIAWWKAEERVYTYFINNTINKITEWLGGKEERLLGVLGWIGGGLL
jgi:hypothetical protein